MEQVERDMPQEWYAERVDYLSGFMLDSRFDTLCRALDERTDYLTVMTENMFHAQNASAVIRHCEAFGVQNLHAVETLCPFLPTLNIALGTDKWVDVHRHATTAEALRALKADGYRIVATTPHARSCTPESFDVKAGRFALVLGTEKTGITQEVADVADEFLQIPMYGMVESLNVSASAAIIIYMLTERMRREVPREVWRLDEARRLRILYRWCVESVKDAEALLERGFGDVVQ